MLLYYDYFYLNLISIDGIYSIIKPYAWLWLALLEIDKYLLIFSKLFYVQIILHFVCIVDDMQQ